METIWKTQPSMLLARQTLILHLQYNTPFTVVTSIDHFWGKQWKEYIQDQMPAFMLLTDAENIPWKTKRRTKAESVIEFLFRSLLMHCLGQGLNCVYISGIQMTATKVLGFYMESSARHKDLLRMVSVSIKYCHRPPPTRPVPFVLCLLENIFRIHCFRSNRICRRLH